MDPESRTIELGTLYRSYELDRAAIDLEKRTAELSFSSELPVERNWGYEILDHNPKSMVTSRMKSGAPLLVGHNPNDQVGVVERVWIQDKRGKATVRFGKGNRASEIFQDVTDGIRRLVSVGYRVYELVKDKVEDGVETLRAVRWEPHEISIVSIPADSTVGIGRADLSEAEKPNKVIIQSSGDRRLVESQRNKSMPIETETEIEPVAKQKRKTDELDEALETIHRKEVTDAKVTAERLMKEENKEVISIVERLQKQYPEVIQLAKRHAFGEISLVEFRDLAWKLTTQASKDPSLGAREFDNTLGLSRQELAKYSWRRAIQMAGDPRMQGFERELSDAAVKKYKVEQRGPTSIIIPYDILAWSQRDQLVATASLGGNVVETTLMAGSFIDILRNRMLVARAGATMLPGLVGNIAIPRQSGAASTTWAGSEAATVAESSVTFDQVTLTPKQITARVDYSWLLLQQSTPAIDGLIRSDFQNVLARAIDLAALHGVGSVGQPTGIAATSGIGSVTGGTNGAAPTWANIVGLETEVAIDNADIGTLAYLTNARVRGKLKTTLKGGTTATDGIYIWPEGPINDGFSMLNGYRIGTTNQVASNLTKGTATTVASAIFFGNWADLLIGMWSGLELLTNPYTQASARVIETYAYQAIDIAVRHPESFAAMLDALTT